MASNPFAVQYSSGVDHLYCMFYYIRKSVRFLCVCYQEMKILIKYKRHLIVIKLTIFDKEIKLLLEVFNWGHRIFFWTGWVVLLSFFAAPTAIQRESKVVQKNVMLKEIRDSFSQETERLTNQEKKRAKLLEQTNEQKEKQTSGKTLSNDDELLLKRARLVSNS